MQNIEPYYNWRHLYIADEDERSPFFGRQYNEFEYHNVIYNFYIHPQWDDIDSRTMYLKILFVDYEEHYAIIELFGEWNDAIENDIQTLKRSVIDDLIAKKIFKFILIGENILTFHSDTNDYYEEWYEDIRDHDGWIVGINFQPHAIFDFQRTRITYYITFLEIDNWRTLSPEHLFEKIEDDLMKMIE